jgi:N-formylglutamate deformylase
LVSQSAYSFIANGRFKGGYITRHCPDPANRSDAAQPELPAQFKCIDEQVLEYLPKRAAEVRTTVSHYVASGAWCIFFKNSAARFRL